MNLDVTQISDIKIGMVVQIIDLDDELIEGEITHIISKYNNSNGIMVKIKEGQKGNVKKIIKTTIEQDTGRLSDEIVLLKENWQLEYKRTFKPHNISEDKKWIPSFNVYKAIAGFANAEGGRLVIGVEDIKNESLKITGLEHDFNFIVKNYNSQKSQKYSNNEDGMELRLIDEFSHYFLDQPLANKLIKINFVGSKPKEMMCIIDVKRSKECVVFYDDHAPEGKRGPNFYVRVNNQTIPYRPHDFIRYWVNHINDITGYS